MTRRKRKDLRKKRISIQAKQQKRPTAKVREMGSREPRYPNYLAEMHPEL